MKKLAFVIILLFPAYSLGQCNSFNINTNHPQIANEISGNPPGNSIAFATWDGFGNPTIIYSLRYYQLAPLMKQFVWLHECAHLSIPTSDEIQANCTALLQLRDMGLTHHDEQLIANWTMSAGPVGMQYGGTGEAFWALTLNCAGSR